MSEPPRLIFTGNVIVDIVMTIKALPEPGGDTIASRSQITAGGGYNVMVAAKRDGLDVVFAGQYGSGPFGDIVRAALADGGITVAHAGLDGLDSGYCVALVDHTTERTFITSVGAEGQLTSALLEQVAVSDHDIVYVSGYSLAHPVNAQALPGWLESLPTSVRVITDPSPLIGELDPQLLHRVLRRTDILSANAREARIASRGADSERAAQWFLRHLRPGGFAIVRDGADGCWLAGGPTGDAATHIPGFHVRAVDTNGAGDAHGGVLAAALARQLPAHRAVIRANAAAALAVTQAGPATAPTSAEIDQLIDSQPTGSAT